MYIKSFFNFTKFKFSSHYIQMEKVLYLNEKLYFITVKREVPQLAKLAFYVFSLRIKIFKRFIIDAQVN